MTTAVAPTADAPEDRARRPGPSGVRRAVFWGVFVVLVATMAWGVHGLVAKPGLNTADPQSWLPKQQLDHPVDQTVVGTVAHPALTVEGDYVEVRTPTFSALAVVNGPVVPGEGLPVLQQFTTCTWTISLSHVHGTVPISVADFDSIDHLQTVYKPTLVPGQPPLPAALHTGPEPELQDPLRHARRRGAPALGPRRRPHRGQVGLPGRERLNGRPGSPSRPDPPVEGRHAPSTEQLLVKGLPRGWACVATFVTLVGAGGPGAGRPRPHRPRPLMPRARCTPRRRPRVQDAGYLTDVAKADSDLATYVQQDGNVALRAMLTDGAAFCAFLRRGGGIDNALVDVAVGAQSVESQTHLPANVHTFNTLESVALIDLCPGEQRLVPPRSAASCTSSPHR